MKATTQNEDLVGVLRATGLTSNESKIYLACLELGPNAIWEIAKKSGLKRPTCYDLLRDLSVKGLASSYDDGRRIIYSVISPRQLSRVAETKLNRITNAVSELEALASKAAEKPKIRIFEGVEGIKQSFGIILDQPRGSELLILGTNMLGIGGYTEYFQQEFIPSRVERGIKTRSIFADTVQNRGLCDWDKKLLHETRLLTSETYRQTTHTFIISDLVMETVHSDTFPFSVVTESLPIAADHRVRFELLWEMASAMRLRGSQGKIKGDKGKN